MLHPEIITSKGGDKCHQLWNEVKHLTSAANNTAVPFDEGDIPSKSKFNPF